MSDFSLGTDSKADLPCFAVAWPFLAAACILAAELLALYFLYHPERFIFECRAYAPPLFCGFLSAGVMRGAALIGAVALYLIARPALRDTLRGAARPGWGWGCMQLAGVLAILAPQAFLAEGATPPTFAMAAALWVVGGIVATVGTLFFFVPAAGWAATARRAGPALPLLLLGALILPDVAPWVRDQVQYLWQYEPVTEITFHASHAMLELSGREVYSDLAGPHLGIEGFVVGVGRQCSGVEGFVLITSFLGLYFWLFRDKLRFPRVWLLVPIGLALSWCLNVVRISVLIWIGAFYSPELAIDAFHSHAGWLMFTALSIGFAAAVHRVAWFRRDAVVPAGNAAGLPPTIETEPDRSEPRVPFFQDPAAARIFPFMVFMGSALLASTFSQTPSVFYPFRALAMLAVLVLFWPVLRKMDWRIDPFALGAGAVIGILWLATAPVAAAADMALAEALAGMGAAAFVIWAVSRVLGTALLVPVIEELFFRGYVMARLDIGGMPMRLLAIAVSAGLFACLHDRWLAAGLAGVVFGLLALRRGRLADAIWAHAIANTVIAAWAVRAGDWSVI